MASTAPRWLGPLLRADPPALRERAAVVWAAAHPWNDLRAALGAAILSDPSRARIAIAALRRVAVRRRDATAAARLLRLEARAVHRSGRLDEAAAAYAEADRLLRAADLPVEARGASVERVDALAMAGRVDESVRLGDRLLRTFRARETPSWLLASLLVNRGNALRLRGDLEEARRSYEEAGRVYAAADNGYGVRLAGLNQGVVALEAGDVVEALARFRDAAQAFAAADEPDLALDARHNVAWAEIAAGRLGEAIRELDTIAALHHAAKRGRREGHARVDLADALRRAGDPEAAEQEALRAASALRAARSRGDGTEALWLAAASAADARAPARALAHLRRARREAVATGRTALTLRCDVLLADVAARDGRWPAPRALAALTRRARAAGLAGLVAEVGLLRATCAAAGGRQAEAAKRFADLVRESAARPWVRVAAETGLAELEAKTGRGIAAALARLRRVAAFLDRVRSALPGSWLRTAFVAERLDPYLARIDLLLRRGRPADRREAEALLDALAARRFLGVRAPLAGGARLARLRARLEAIYDRLARGEGPTRGVEAGSLPEATLERRARTIERAVADAWRSEERHGDEPVGAHTDVPGPTPLPEGVALVHLWRHGDRVRGLVREQDRVAPGVDLGSVDDLEGYAQSLRIRARRWAFLRVRDPEGADPGGVERILEALAARLLPALDATSWPAAVRVVADPRLPDVPWELLPFAGRRLGETHRLLRVPAGAVRARGVPRGEGTVVVGVGDPDLPGVEREVAAIAEAAGAVRVYAGAAATRGAVRDALRDARVVHIAGHGWAAEGAPPLGGVRVADGWFTVADLPPEGVGAELVVLAACRTGRETGRAAQAWGGLVTALLGAGARCVVWTEDDVDDEAAARLMTLFHQALKQGDTDAAFGEALARGGAEVGHLGAVLAFRRSGVPA